MRHLFLLFVVFSISLAAQANDHLIRWTGTDDADGSVAHVLKVLSQKTGHTFSESDFTVNDDRDLAFNHYKRLVQVVDGLPVHGKSIRIWTERDSERAVQVEADLDITKTSFGVLSRLTRLRKSATQIARAFSSAETAKLVRGLVRANADDPYIRGLDWKDEWVGDRLIRSVKIKGKRGTTTAQIDLVSHKLVSSEYRQFPQADLLVEQITNQDEISIPAQVYPVYEEYEGAVVGTQLPRVPVELHHIRAQIPNSSGDIYAPLKTQRYLDNHFDPVLGMTEAGRAQGFWAMGYVKEQAAKIRDGLPLVANGWKSGLLLQGKYATINIHPDAIKAFGPLSFQPAPSAAFFPNWAEVTGVPFASFEMIPGNAFSGKPLSSLQEAWDRPARRLPDHNPAQYMNDGFDEIQVYYAINTLMEQLQDRGFQDPELSTRPFNAFLFNPDIAYRDNAFYTDDTINFTTYSPNAPNYARDNATIWHELGHGVMDRLMGDGIELADTGGLSEGMADFVAAMVVRAVTAGVPFPGSDLFRIINNTGFHLTNEVHDDGESYGGAMKDFMDAVIAKYGQPGLDKVTDLVLEAMRLTRDFPGLTATEWFQHILFADSLGRPGVRAAGELAPFLTTALAGRNFRFDNGAVADFKIVDASDNHEVVAGAAGSRDHEIRRTLAKTDTADFALKASVKGSDQFQFRFPVQIRVQFNGGPLQGSVHWVNEESGVRVYTLNSEADTVTIPLQVSGNCDAINRADGSCSDYVYVQVWNNGEANRPTAKKRFYVRVKNPS